MDLSEEAVVVPLVPVSGELTTEKMLRMLLNREALVIQRGSPSGEHTSTGMLAQTGGAFARAVSGAIGQARHAPADSAGLYRLILPAGRTARDLVPAIGGGFRGMVRTAGATGIQGHARLVPASALGAGAAVAAGPLIATVGLAVAAEMLAQHQMSKKLDTIKNAIAGIQGHLDAQDRAILTTAEQEAKKVVGYLLDQATLPAIAGASHAFADVASLTNRRIERLERWTETAAKYESADRVNAKDLMGALIGKREKPIEEFEAAVAQTYHALGLRARVVILEKVAAEFSNPDRSLPHVEEILRAELATLADRQQQLVTLMDDLNVMQIDGSKVPIAVAGKKTLSMRTSFSRLARALHSSPDALPMLTSSEHTMLELSPTSRGLEVVAPPI